MKVISLHSYMRRVALLDELAEFCRPGEALRLFEHLTETQRNEMSEKVAYTVQETAALLSVHPQTIRAWIHSGELRAVKIGSTYRIDRQGMQAFWTAKGGGKLFADSPDEGASDE